MYVYVCTQRAARNAFDTPTDLSAAKTLFATLSNSQKVRDTYTLILEMRKIDKCMYACLSLCTYKCTTTFHVCVIPG